MKTFIIAEAGSNHDGDINRAKQLIAIAAKAGADAVKFQLIPPFKPEWINHLIWWCDEKKIEFMATPFNQTGINALKGKVNHWKIASTEAADENFVEQVMLAAGNCPVFISDGAVDDLPIHWRYASNVTRMACVVEYPAKEEDYHFLTFRWGLSDHTKSATMLPMMAVAAGASVIEKHFTDDKTRPGPDHSYALNPEQLKEMVYGIRLVERIKANKKKTITTYNGRKLQWPA